MGVAAIRVDQMGIGLARIGIAHWAQQGSRMASFPIGIGKRWMRGLFYFPIPHGVPILGIRGNGPGNRPLQPGGRAQITEE